MLPPRYGPDTETWDCECGATTLESEPTCRYCGSLKPDSLAARIMRSAEERQKRLKRERERDRRQWRD